MVSSKLVKFSSPVARSSLIALSALLLVDAILTLHSAILYPYLIDYHTDELVADKNTITIFYTIIAVLAFLVSVSSAVACYKNVTNYLLIHAGITGIFLPILILILFSTKSARYDPLEYEEEYRMMIKDYRISSHSRGHHTSQDSHESSANTNETKHYALSSFINYIDSIQNKFSCCGVKTAKDWLDSWKNYIAPTCCPTKERQLSVNKDWSNMFGIKEENFEFTYCTENSTYKLGCLTALREDEHSKYDWLCDLIVFMILMTISNTIVSLLLFGLIKTEDSEYEGENEHELSIVGVSSKPRPSQPTITSIRHRPSVVHNLGAINNDIVTARATAVRFNISNSPRTSISGPSKFSMAARRGSSFI